MRVVFARVMLLFTSVLLVFTCLFSGVDRVGSPYQSEAPDKVLLNAVLIGDTHSSDTLRHNNSRTLAKLFSGIGKSETETDALVIAGDLTQCALPKEYAVLAATIKRYNHAGKIIPALGNHDVRGDMDVEDYAQNMENYYAFCRVMGAETCRPYWFTKVNGYYFIVLGAEAEVKDRSYISPAQLKWLEGRLNAAETTGRPAFIICHQVIDHTNNVDNLWYFDGSIGEQSDAVLDVIRKHTDSGMRVVFISGHLHQPFGDCSFEQPWKNLYCLNLPSAQFTDGGGEGCMLEVYADRVLLRARNFITGEWLPQSWTVDLG